MQGAKRGTSKAQQRENILTSAREAMEPGPGAWDRKGPWDKSSGSGGWCDSSHAGSSRDGGWSTADKKNQPKVGSPAPSWADQSERSETLLPWRPEGDTSDLKQQLPEVAQRGAAAKSKAAPPSQLPQTGDAWPPSDKVSGAASAPGNAVPVESGVEAVPV